MKQSLETARRVSHCAVQRHKIALLAAVTAATPASNQPARNQESQIVVGARDPKAKSYCPVSWFQIKCLNIGNTEIIWAVARVTRLLSSFYDPPCAWRFSRLCGDKAITREHQDQNIAQSYASHGRRGQRWTHRRIQRAAHCFSVSIPSDLFSLFSIFGGKLLKPSYVLRSGGCLDKFIKIVYIILIPLSAAISPTIKRKFCKLAR